jgi:M6 family metalloprotease-like protein
MNRTCLSCLGVIVAATGIMTALPAHAAPVRGKLVKPFQPDGTRIDALCWGDEYYVVAESLDGYTLVRDPKTGFICYAGISADGTRLVSTGVVVKEKAPADLGIPSHVRIKREAAAAAALAARERATARRGRKPQAAVQPARSLLSPTTGTVQGICLMVDFSDDVASIPRANVVNYCNQVGYTGYGNNGSVRDYYFDVSNGQLTFTHYVTSAYFRASHAKTYYADPSVTWGDRAEEMVKEALDSLNNSGFDFSQYDADNNGEVDSVSCFYAGTCTNAWAEGLWPGNIGMDSAWSADGVNVVEFQITDMGTSLTIETFCHECGHLLMDWPDLYDYGDDSAGVGAFCIMCNGASATNPIEPCAYLKTRAGWTNVVELTSPQSLLTATAGTNTVYKVPHPTLSREYYLIENRQRTGRDSALPDDGLAIWHIDTDGSNSNQQMTPSSHYLVTLVQADGRWDFENDQNWGDTTDLYAAPAYTACTPYTSPTTTWWDGSASAIFVENISASADSMTFSFNYAPGLWVDFAYAGWPELGNFFNPYNTLAEGMYVVSSGGNLWIKGGSSAETGTMTKAMVVYAYGGSVVIGQ